MSIELPDRLFKDHTVLINRVKFYPDLSLKISIDLPVARSVLINRVKLYPDLSLEISIDFSEC